MALASGELYELFLSLSASRLGAAKHALELRKNDERRAALIAALAPIAVDAGLLGAEGVGALASAIARAPDDALPQVRAALSELERAITALGVSDASGARVNETELLAAANALTAHGALGFTLLSEDSAPETAPSALAGLGEDADDLRWAPSLAEDMIGAFLDECVERTEGLAERLIELEQRGNDKELVSAVFRDLHTLKGSSAFAGLTKLNRVAHRAEDLIGELRAGKRPADRALIDVLLAALDAMRAITEKARSGAAIDIDIAPLLERLANPNRAPAPQLAAQEHPQPQEAVSVATARANDGQGTLRIEFEKVDRLLNLVGEIVLARGRLSAAAEVQGLVVREVQQLRKRLSEAHNAPRARASGSDLISSTFSDKNSAIIEDLERTERVLRETFGDVDSGLGGLALAVGQLRDTVMKLRMVPIARLFTKYQRTVRELSHKLGKEVNVELHGGDTELDKVLVERLEDPLLHLVRNAVDHGIELPEDRAAAGKSRIGTVRLSAAQRGGQILVVISDDGHGLDPAKLKRKAVQKELITQAEADEMPDDAALNLIFRAGFSTAETLSDVSGRGVGMDVVRDAIQRLKGNVELASTVGVGTTVELSLPLTLAITQVLTARVGGELVAIPLDAVVSAQTLYAGQLEPLGTGACLRVGERLIPVFHLAEVLGLSGNVALGDADEGSVVIVSVGSAELGLIVQQVLGRHEVVIKSLGSMLSAAPCAAGAAVVGERMVLVLDLSDVAQRAQEPHKSLFATRPRLREVRSDRARILVAEDSDVIREAIRRELSQAGFDVTTAADGEIALSLSKEQHFDAVSSDVMMPHKDGYELVRALRSDPKYRETPIVLVTSKDARIDAVRGYDAGADAYLTKPADADELIHTLDMLLRQRRGQSR